MAAGDLCDYSDVISYVPGYTGQSADEVLLGLITAESELFARDAKREIAQPSDTAATRLFTIDHRAAKARTVPVGDLSTAEDITVELLKADGTADVDVADVYVPLYDRERNPTTGWQPVTELAFPSRLDGAPDICAGKVLSVHGIWGFPLIPSFVRQGVGARVVIRYLVDAAAQGTDFADAAQLANLSFGNLTDLASDALLAVQRKPWP